ncbi:MAG: flagellar protein export ATPase FliI [Alphaproteobacteria bacterium]|nr:flagellar protein export ATPase FliI [Alphaproteobacteria bacterium]MBU0798574.1 flagellar protein export ATPase FliI [Alphaproteobacteria bacterium]MBU0888129.1 flagellar protein export ATPase FliI [Alphaproteobacteria bacterium]MBU1811574.1 flagellar protein export ATPase FliI [Alphaproteobacteria bacterium]
METPLRHLNKELERLPGYTVYGSVSAVQGMMVEVRGAHRSLSIGDRCHLVTRQGSRVPCEVVGFRSERALLMPFGTLDGIGIGCKAEIEDSEPVIHPHEGWLGRVVNALGEPVDGKGPLPQGPLAVLLRNKPPSPHARQPIGAKIDLGIRAINTFLSTCRGQRMGIFAGSGVGKSILMSMMARFTQADVNVIGLVGERGREVREFIHEQLGPEGLARSVVVVATSDESPLMRRQAAQITLSIAEYFRDLDRDVLCMIDSITRFAMAQREIGLSTGEPPASKGYTPTVFAELPRLLERAGPGMGEGTITGLFTVLVEGDDHNEPIADAVRGILDGHIVLERQIAERGRYPAINILRSVSRALPNCNTPGENQLLYRARRLMSSYEDMAEMIRLGAYRIGTDPGVDESIRYHEPLEEFLRQDSNERAGLQDGYDQLAAILGDPAPGPIA